MQPISQEIFEKKYMINDDRSPEEVLSQVAETIATAEKTKVKREEWAQKFTDEIISGRLIPAGRILANARINARMPYYNNCYTIGIKDSIEGIYESLKEDASISKTGGGVGMNFSKLRFHDAPLARGGSSSGSVSFMKVFNESAKVIMTGGSRRSAHIAVLNVDHPDIEEFITCKQGDSNGVLTQFNISVGITDAFMEAVNKDIDWDLKFKGEVIKTVSAKYLYELMTKNAYEHNEPGILNLDTINRFNNGSYAFNIQEVNPCGEIVMPPYSICCLSSLNLTKFVRNPFESNSQFDFDAFAKSVRIGVRFLDNVLDATEYPLKKIKDMSKDWRRIGLGFTGLGDAFAMMGLAYGKKESQDLAHKVGATLRDESYRASVNLAIEKGPFPLCDKGKLSKANFVKTLPGDIQNDISKHGLRNIALNTTAPTGTTSLSLGQNCSSGIEPIFSLEHKRDIRTGHGDETKSEVVYDYAWLKYLEMNKIADNVPDYFATTFDVDVYDAIDMQAIFQKYIDHSISKTLNLPVETTYEDYSKLFNYAYSKGLKGFTSFNPGGSMAGILQASSTGDNLQRNPSGVIIRPKRVPCDIHEVKFGGNNYLVLIGLLENTPYEVFVTLNENRKDYIMKGKKKGAIVKERKGHYNLVVENGEDTVYIDDIVSKFDPIYLTLGRFISMSLRSNLSLQFVVEQLLKDKNFAGFEKTVGRVLKKYLKEGEKVKSSMICPECGNVDLRYTEGCISCTCGWAKC